MKKSFLVGWLLVGVVVSAIIYAQTTANLSTQTDKISALDVNAEFASADKNNDGILDKEEFKTYFALLKATKTVTKNKKEEDSCCSGNAVKKNCSETVGVKSIAETPVKKENSCCPNEATQKDVTKTIEVKSAAEAPVKKECSCCSNKTGKEETETESVLESVSIPKSISSVRLPDHLVQIVLKATNALSSDNLAEYQNFRLQLIEAIKVTDDDVSDFLKPFAEKLVMGGNLKEARQPFELFSNTFADIIKSQPVGERQAYIFQCNMSPVLGKARWIQKQNREVLNPFFGSEMLNCGIELQ
jgi:hypothetical protein